MKAILCALPDVPTEANLLDWLPTYEQIDKWLWDIMDSETGFLYAGTLDSCPNPSPRYKWARELHRRCEFCPF